MCAFSPNELPVARLELLLHDVLEVFGSIGLGQERSVIGEITIGNVIGS
jgi:hypothetical protein